VTDTGSGAHYLDIPSAGFSGIPLIIAVRHRAFAKVADNLDIFVAMEAKSFVGAISSSLRTMRFPTALWAGLP
jgi:hypothetical protein